MASASAKWSRAPSACAAWLRSRASSRIRSATSGPICFDASHAARRVAVSSLVRRISAIALSSTRRPSICAAEVVEGRLDARSRARRWRGGGRPAPGGARRRRGAGRAGGGAADRRRRDDRVACRAHRGEASRRRRGTRAGRARRRCGARRPRATTGCSTPTTLRPARARAGAAGPRVSATSSAGERSFTVGILSVERMPRRRSAAAMTARAWRASGSSTIWPSNAMAAWPPRHRVVVGGEQAAGPVELLGRRRERPVGQRDLGRVDAELAPVAERPALGGVGEEVVLGVEAGDDLVDRGHAGQPGRQRHPGPGVEHLGAAERAHAAHVGDVVLGAEVRDRDRRHEQLAGPVDAERALDARRARAGGRGRRRRARRRRCRAARASRASGR